MKGKVQTVCGWVEGSALGRTLTHEHLFMEFDVAYTPARLEEAHMEDCDFTLNNLGWIRQNPYSHKKNIRLDQEDAEAVMEEVRRFRQSGGGTIVENSTHGLNRNVAYMRDVSLKHGVHIVAGTGYYVKAAQHKERLDLTVEDMAALMTREVTQGCDDFPQVKCGIIGEVGCSWPLFEFERRSIQAAGEAQASLGCPVMIHPGRHHQSPEEILRIYTEAGGKPAKMVMGHLDRTIHKLDALLDFASLGTYCEYDLFGIETSHYQLESSVDMPSDAQRIACIKYLVDNGFQDKILISHDIHTRHRLEVYGGHGFSHILKNVVPKMLDRGLSQAIVDKLLVANPSTWLTFTQ